MPKRLIFVRHGQTDYNVQHRMMGWETQVGLNNQGRMDAQSVAKRLGSYLIDAMYHSDLLRTTETAEIISTAFSLPTKPSFYLRERDLGRFAGLTFSELKETSPDDAIKFLDHNDPDWNGLMGESLRQVLSRFDTFLTSLAASHADDTVLLVTHSGFIHTILRDYFQFFSKESFEEVGHSSITVLDRVGDRYQLTEYNKE